ncbi:MAG: hypothetical protein ACTHMY_28350 [Solirubrobacteraceae bacterium]
MTTTRAGTAGALTGAMASAAFALAWAMWGASGLPSGAAGVIRIVAVVAALSLIARASVLRRRSPSGVGEGSLFSSTAYRWIVAVEVLALFGGGAVLTATGETAYTIAWFALIVGAHFLAFGRVFWAGFYVVGVVMIGGALAGAITGLAGGSAAAIRAVTGLVAAADLFLAAAWTVLWAARHERGYRTIS